MESEEHRAAKEMVLAVVSDFLNGKSEPPRLQRKCLTCFEIGFQNLPKSITAVETERSVGGFRPDLVLFDSKGPKACIEIAKTSRVRKRKNSELGLPIVQLDCKQVLKDPRKWIPISGELRETRVCLNCVSLARKLLELSRRTRSKFGHGECRDPVFCSVHKCWKCKNLIPVYTWRKKVCLWEKDFSPKVPIPPTIRKRKTRIIELPHFVNCCPICRFSQGDFFLYMEADGPFFGVRTDPEEDEDGNQCGPTPTFTEIVAQMAVQYFSNHGELLPAAPWTGLVQAPDLEPDKAPALPAPRPPAGNE